MWAWARDGKPESVCVKIWKCVFLRELFHTLMTFEMLMVLAKDDLLMVLVAKDVVLMVPALSCGPLHNRVSPLRAG